MTHSWILNRLNPWQSKFSNCFGHLYDEFYNEWSEIGTYHWERYLKGNITFKELQVHRMYDLLAETAIGINLDNAWDYYLIYVNHYEKNWSLFDDVIPCLESLKGRRLGIITNGDSIQQRQKLKNLGIPDYFQVIMVSGDIGVSKPSQEIFTEACRMAGKSPAECIFIGDNLEVDILACERAGMKGIWLNRKNNDINHERTIRSLFDIKIDFEG